jgi:Domain of unknown function (DUF4349)
MRTMRSQGRARRVVGATVLVALGMAGVGLVAGCSGSGSSSASSAENGPAVAAPRAAAGSGNTSGGSGSGSAPTATSTTNVAETGDLIVTAALQLAAKSPDQEAAQAEQTVISAGGYVAAEAEGVGPQTLPSANASAADTENADTGVTPMTIPTVNGAPNTDQALLVLRVPPTHLDAVLTALAGTGTVSYRTLSETNVTGQVADVASRITSAQDSLTELRGMIDKAASMNDLISLETALSTRESDLESLEAQQRALADQIQYATVTVGYFVPAAPSTTPAAKPTTHHSGFVAGLLDGWHAFLATLRVLLALIGWLLPFAIVIALLWWPARKLLRRRGLAAEGADPEAVTHTWWRRRPVDRAE